MLSKIVTCWRKKSQQREGTSVVEKVKKTGGGRTLGKSKGRAQSTAESHTSYSQYYSGRPGSRPFCLLAQMQSPELLSPYCLLPPTAETTVKKAGARDKLMLPKGKGWGRDKLGIWG